MQFSQMQTDAADLLQEITKIPTDYSSTKLKHYINRGYYDFVRRTKCFEGSVLITTVSEQFSYSASDSANIAYIYLPYSVRYIQDSDTDVGEILKPYPGGYSALPNKLTYSALPTYYWVKNVFTRASTVFGTWPIASTADETILIQAFMRPVTELSQDTDVPVIMEEYQDALVYYAASKIFGLFGHRKKEWRDKSLEYKAIYDNFVEEAIGNMFSETEDEMRIFDAY